MAETDGLVGLLAARAGNADRADLLLAARPPDDPRRAGGDLHTLAMWWGKSRGLFPHGRVYGYPAAPAASCSNVMPMTASV